MILIATGKPSSTATETELAERVWNELTSFFHGFRCIHVWAEAGTITLSGRVKSYYSRQMAVVTAKGVEGVRRVIDRLAVEEHPPAHF